MSAEHVGEEPDRRKAERGLRLKLLVELKAPPDILTEIHAIWGEFFDDTLEKVMDGALPSECLKVLREAYTLIDNHLLLGANAMSRLAEKRLLSAQIVARQQATREASTGA